MTEIEVTDHAIALRPGPGGNMPTWGLSIGEKRIGTVWETERGYAGHVEGTTAEGTTREYSCPEKPFRQQVIDQLGVMVERLGII